MKLVIEVELDTPSKKEGEEFPPFPTVNTVMVNGKKVNPIVSTSTGAAEMFWSLLETEQEGYSLSIHETLY